MSQQVRRLAPESPPTRAALVDDLRPSSPRSGGGDWGLGRRKRKVFLYSHDTYGLGHLRRNLAIAEHLLSREGSYSVRLLTGSPVIGDWSLPPGLDVTSLEPVVKVGVETYAPRCSSLPFTLVKAYREALILRAVIEERPDVFLVDHAPAGMNGELLATLAYIQRELPGTKVILGLRDILDCPETVQKIWREQAIIPLIENLYDGVLVYGDRELFDVVEGYGVPAEVAAKFTYCGYISRPAVPATPRQPSARRTVIVTAGGGEDGHFLMEAYLKARALLKDKDVRSLIVTGPLMSAAQRQALEDLGAGQRDVEIIASTSDLPKLLQQADLIVAMGGYNTSVEIVASGRPAIIVPRAAPRAEQRMRAALFARLGLVWSIEPGPELDSRLAGLIDSVLAGVTARIQRHGLKLDGAACVGRFLDTLTQPETQVLRGAQ